MPWLNGTVASPSLLHALYKSQLDAAAPILQPLPSTSTVPPLPFTRHNYTRNSGSRSWTLAGYSFGPCCDLNEYINRKLTQETPSRREAECSLHDAEATTQ